MERRLISVVVPVYNEELNILPMYQSLSKVIPDAGYAYEIIYVDNCSVDSSVEEIRKLAKQDRNVRGIVMSRNFGSSQPSEIAGMHNAKGNALVFIDGDIQDPPELIGEFIKKWEEGYEVVYGIREKRRGSIIKRVCYKLFYRIFKKLSYVDMPLDAGDFGLIDRKVVEVIKELKENEIFFRGLRAWVGFKQIGIKYTREDRSRGKTSYSFTDNIKWAKMGIYNFSYKPLELISKIAFTLTALSFVGIIYFFIIHYVIKETPHGFSTQVILTLFLSGIQLLALGIMGEYIARIFNEVKGRPRYVIREIINENNGDKDKSISTKEIITGGE